MNLWQIPNQASTRILSKRRKLYIAVAIVYIKSFLVLTFSNFYKFAELLKCMSQIVGSILESKKHFIFQNNYFLIFSTQVKPHDVFFSYILNHSGGSIHSWGSGVEFSKFFQKGGFPFLTLLLKKYSISCIHPCCVFYATRCQVRKFAEV